MKSSLQLPGGVAVLTSLSPVSGWLLSALLPVCTNNICSKQTAQSLSRADITAHLDVKLLLHLGGVLLLSLHNVVQVCMADFGVNRLAEDVQFLVQSCL